MVKGMEHLHRMNELMKEFKMEMEALQKVDMEHRERYRVVEDMLVDLDHVPEILSLNGSESAKTISLYRKTLLERNDLQDYFSFINTHGKELEFLRGTVESVVPRFEKFFNNYESDMYRFRTEEGYDFFNQFKEVDKRTAKKYVMPSGKVVGTDNVVEVNLVENMASKPNETESTNITHVEKVQPVSKTRCKVSTAGNQWYIREDSEDILNTANIVEVVEYILDNSDKEFVMNPAEKKRLLHFIKMVKKKPKGKSLFFIDGVKRLEADWTA